MKTPLYDELLEALRVLPGVGPRSAQRMALHMLERNREGAVHLAEVLARAAREIGHCERCRSLSEAPLCSVCDNPQRDATVVCVVESPADQLAIEAAGSYRGTYFVLRGRLSPIDGIGPEDVGLPEFLARVSEGTVTEVIIATNATVEGEATAHYIAQHLRDSEVTVSRIAHGVPMGGELEYVDGGTLSQAFSGRTRIV